MDDAAFDAMLPAALRRKSVVHFTPVAVARRSAELLVDKPGKWVLDVGAAVGKFCIVGAAAAPSATFVGIERRQPLVRIAKTIAGRLALPNVTFLHGDAVDVDWTTFQAFYLYNPFTEHLKAVAKTLDRALELDPGYFVYYVKFVLDRLKDARIGTRVVTYHGYGGERPPGYRIAHRERIGSGGLELWVKTSSSRPRRKRAP